MRSIILFWFGFILFSFSARAQLNPVLGTLGDALLAGGASGVPAITPSYAVLKKKPDAGYHIPMDSYLYFKYEGEYNYDNIQYTIYNYRRQAIPCNLNTAVKKYGDNRYYIDLSSCPALSTGTYMLEVFTEKKDTYFLKFTYQKLEMEEPDYDFEF